MTLIYLYFTVQKSLKNRSLVERFEASKSMLQPSNADAGQRRHAGFFKRAKAAVGIPASALKQSRCGMAGDQKDLVASLALSVVRQRKIAVAT